MLKRRKGVAIVESSKGILLVRKKGRPFTLPGGGAKKWESRKRAAIRELHEETGLQATKAKYLFPYVGDPWQAYGNKMVRNYSKVFLIKAHGKARPRSEINSIGFWKPSKKIALKKSAKTILKGYLEMKKSKKR